jgi:hypothetical protein
MRYKTIQLPKEMVEQIRQTIENRPDLGYVSVKGFVEDSVRRRLETIEGKRVKNLD